MTVCGVRNDRRSPESLCLVSRVISRNRVQRKRGHTFWHLVARNLSEMTCPFWVRGIALHCHSGQPGTSCRFFCRESPGGKRSCRSVHDVFTSSTWKGIPSSVEETDFFVNLALLSTTSNSPFHIVESVVHHGQLIRSNFIISRRH